MGRNKKKPNNTAKKKKISYKGPYQDNANKEFQNVKRSMRTQAEGPTVDTFSPLDSTTNLLPNEETAIRQDNNNLKRPTKEKKFVISFENLLLVFISIIATGIGIIVYTHGNKLVGVEIDINYIKEDFQEQKEIVDKIDEKTNSIDNKLNLLDQKIEFNKENNRQQENIDKKGKVE